MEAKYRVGQKVDLNHNNKVLKVEVFGIVNSNLEEEVLYTLRSGAQFYLAGESEISERSDE
jgi:hypothetical protein